MNQRPIKGGTAILQVDLMGVAKWMDTLQFMSQDLFLRLLQA